MLSTRSNFLQGVGRGGPCAEGPWVGVSFTTSWTLPLAWVGVRTIGVAHGREITKRFAGVVGLDCTEGVGNVAVADLGVRGART